ncbi:DUF3892 domain-containing protein [Sphingorhabdus contaminans]|uniref:DUF3892 domain-containing protein n=1 Tax=Sphingorhabdus contaminans TaxID=1343899 RepID=A0A553WA78_9SPHN|nr:DUF3892 domain-containing protein [Sphingorhabdus contaminans]TSB01598.1 DUF3892 domain-containing protein [Sphingorhabdus contaminans]
MAEYKVTCIRSDPEDNDRRIARLGGPGWIKPIEEVISEIENEQHVYWTQVYDLRTEVMVRRHPESNRTYLATVRDIYPHNHLLSLIDCL